MATIQERKSRDGKTSYRAIVRLKGVPPQTATFTRKTDARNWANRVENEIRERRYFPKAVAGNHTLAEAITRYLEDVMPRKPRSAYTQTGQLRWWLDEIGAYSLADLTPDVIIGARDRLAKKPNKMGGKLSTATVNRYMAALSHVLSVARDEWRWLDESPMPRIGKLKEAKGRVRFLDDEERERLLMACRESQSPYLYPIVLLAISTGMRKTEASSLTWDRVDLDRQMVLLLETKSDESRPVPLAGPALKILKDLSRKRDKEIPWVFPGKSGKNFVDIRAPWETALKNAKITNFRFHDLRHSAASYLAMNGASPAEIAEVLGHKSFDMVKRYAHLSEQHTASVVASMNEKIFGNGET